MRFSGALRASSSLESVIDAGRTYQWASSGTQIEMNTTVASSKLIDPVMENNLPRLAGSSKFMAGY
jgi:hypothetical protein